MWSSLRAFGQRLDKAAIRWPIAFAVGTTATRYFIGDLAVQLSTKAPAASSSSGAVVASPGSWINTTRSATFATFGGLYAGTVGVAVYTKLYPRIFGARILAPALFDVVFQIPTLYMSMYYGVKSAFETGVDGCVADPRGVVSRAAQMWKDNFWNDLKLSALVWLPLHAINFRFVPLQWRMSAMAGFGFMWTMVLSFTRGKSQVELELDNQEAKEGSNIVGALAGSSARSAADLAELAAVGSRWDTMARQRGAEAAKQAMAAVAERTAVHRKLGAAATATPVDA